MSVFFKAKHGSRNNGQEKLVDGVLAKVTVDESRRHPPHPPPHIKIHEDKEKLKYLWRQQRR